MILKYILFGLVVLTSSTTVLGQYNHLNYASSLIDSLEKSFHMNHKTNGNKYFIIDLNDDDIFEVVERTNKIELEAPGFLPSNISTAFDYDTIYSFEDGQYLEKTCEFKSYLYTRKSHYELWIELIKKYTANEISNDSFEIIKSNREYFLIELNRLIELTNDKISPRWREGPHR